VEQLKSEYPGIVFKELEVMKVSENRELFKKMIGELGIQGGGVPTFIFKGKFVIGFQQGHHDRLIREMIEMNASSHSKESCANSECKECKENIIDVPVLGKIDAKLVSLPGFTFIIGILDGVNPCAMWVLMFLLTLLVNAKSRKKLVMVGSVFVISSGVVYFLFMTAWLNIFTFMGVATYVTLILGIVALLMGLINMKEFFFFKQGISLMIPEKAKPKLYEKMRKVINNSNFLISLAGTITLAFFVNLIELGCTIGLPAIYTRVLSIQQIDTSMKYLYMALYNAYYVIPLAAIVMLFVLTMGKYRFQEKHAKVLKLISGILMVGLGIILIVKPDLLVFS
ncbi:MAG TPA: hypothetical protein P5044_12215, partial [bacterium]|nr:hypothetical protein [bacterium]